MSSRLVAGFCAALTLFLIGLAFPARPGAAASLTVTTRPHPDDFDGILKRRTLRVLVPFSKTLFFIDRGREMGVVAELARALEEDINRRRQLRILRFHVVIIPTAHDKLLPLLVEGRGDAVAGNMTITPERAALVDFATPVLTGVDEIVVAGPAAPKLEKRDDLAGLEVHIRRSSSFAEHLAALNADFTARGLKPMDIVFIDENLEDADILDMVHAGILPFAIVDSHTAGIWAQIFPGLVVRPDLAIASGGKIAWAIRKNSPLLRAELDPFFETHKAGTSFGNQIRKRYFNQPALMKNAYEKGSMEKFRGLAETFRKYGAEYDFDYLMLAAQAYQESQLDQSRRSRAGAVGVMQIKPSTAAAEPISITGVAEDSDANIHAGVAYLRHMANNYLDDPRLSANDRMLMTFAAYNAGPANLRKFQKAAENQGLDPTIWFDNVEQGAARVVGRETVQYVSNIYKYYIAYSLIRERGASSRDAVRQVPNPDTPADAPEPAKTQ